MKTSHDVRVRAIRTYRGARKTTYTVRWTVAGKEFQDTFATKALAESERARIIRAQRDGVAFDCDSGLPEPEARKRTERTWLAHAMDYVDARWPHWSSNHRRNTAEALTDVTLSFLATERGKPNDEAIREALFGWAFSKARRDREPMPDDVRRHLDWLSRNTLDVRRLDDPALIRRTLDRLALRRDGKPAAPSTVARKRAALSGALAHAVELQLMETNPVKRVSWKAPAQGDAVDRRRVVNPDQATSLLRSVRDIAPEFEAFFGCLYYAALRPEEALHLRWTDYEPGGTAESWGWLTLNGATVTTRERWSGRASTTEDKALKHRGVAATRRVPVAPPLADLLAAHVERYGTARDGRLFVTQRGPGGRYRPTDGQPLSSSAYSRVWRQARAQALTKAQEASPLAGRPYDLRHAAVSLWLNSGVPATQVAEWAGHSVAVLLRVYAACIDGGESAALDRIGAALG